MDLEKLTKDELNDLEKLTKDELNDFAAQKFPDLVIKSTYKHAKMVKLIRKELETENQVEDKETNVEDKETNVDNSICDCGSQMKFISSYKKNNTVYSEHICDGHQSKHKCGKKKTTMKMVM